MPEAAQRQLYPHFDSPNYPVFEQEILAFWHENDVFAHSLELRKSAPVFTFYEGPPSANGTPGIHHVMARAIKDIFCRYKTMQGHLVLRKAGWDTHGLPVELQVEKELGITKQDIGTKISVAEYNQKCRETVMRYKDQWDELTQRMGFWVDLAQPYLTYENAYIESCWSLLKRLFEKGLLYKGYAIQPYSPAAGTGLSSHELNQPGTYKPVKDVSVTAMFRVVGWADGRVPETDTHMLAWTTTPWTLPSNAALAVGAGIGYAKVQTFNPYTFQPVAVILAHDRLGAYFPAELAELPMEAYAPGDKKIPFRVLETMEGRQIVGARFAQLMPYVQPAGDAFRVIAGDFVTTEDGTGIVHVAPTFGADDQRVALQAGIPSLMVMDENGEASPLVDRTGRFVRAVSDGILSDFDAMLAGQTSDFLLGFGSMIHSAAENHGPLFVRPEYVGDGYPDVNLAISLLLRNTGRAFKSENYEHNYPHCWRTDKPVLYYPLDSWFIRTSAFRERLVQLNRDINWKPAGTGTGRFGNWLENLVDWNLSRSRYWGTPLPIWVNEGRTEFKCIGSVAELVNEIANAQHAGLTPAFAENQALNHWLHRLVAEGPTGQIVGEARNLLDLHRPMVDEIVLADSHGRPMRREPDLIDVWFDSGAMPYAQWHYPFENQAIFRQNFPADFIAEGVDQTRGWFFTLHALAVMLEDSIAFKNVIANGLVLDKDGNKMSKRKGNVVDPFETLATHGADATRWYMVENAPPWEDLKFSVEGLREGQRKFFNTLFYTYQFFETYANIDGWAPGQTAPAPLAERPELDRWITSKLNTLLQDATAAYDDFDPTRAARAIADFATEQLSNWYVRLSRNLFWKGETNPAKHAAFETLFNCLLGIAQLMAPIAPFFADWLFRNLTAPVQNNGNHPDARLAQPSVHLTLLPAPNPAEIDAVLERRMYMAQHLASLAHGLRKKHKLKVRQPLQKAVVPVLTDEQEADLKAIASLVAAEINVLQVAPVRDSNFLRKNIKPNFRTLGPKVGKEMKAVQLAIGAMTPLELNQLETEGRFILYPPNGIPLTLTPEDVEVSVQDIPGYFTATDGAFTIALDFSLTDELARMGLAREVVNRLQNLRKDSGLAVTDRIRLKVGASLAVREALASQQAYLMEAVLAVDFDLVAELPPAQSVLIDIDGEPVAVLLQKALG